MSLRMKVELYAFFGSHKNYLPYLASTPVSDRGAQKLMDIVSASNKKCKWTNFSLGFTGVGDVGLEALANAFVATNEDEPELILSAQRDVDDDAAIMLAKALHNNPSWTLFDIESTQIGKQGLQALSLSLCENTVWKQLRLKRNVIGDVGANFLASALQQNKSWKYLDLRGPMFDLDGVMALGNALKVNLSWSKLNLCGSLIGTRGVKALAEAMLKNNNKWEMLDLTLTRIGDEGAFALASALEQNAIWKVLDLNLTEIGVDGVKALAEALQGNTQWEFLIIRIDFLGRNGMSAIARHLQQTKDWKRFVVQFHNYDGISFAPLTRSIAQRQPPGRWKSLVLWFRGADSHVMGVLANHLEVDDDTTATDPNIPNIFITNETVQNAMEMADFLGQCWRTMDIIFFDDIKGKYVKENQAMIQATRNLGFGRTMSLHNTQLTYSAAMKLAKSLSNSAASWIHFAMSFSQIGDAGAAMLAQAFDTTAANSCWQCFDVSNSNISDVGVQTLAMALVNNKSWKALSIASTPITDDGVRSLAIALVGKEWHVLDIGFTQIGDKGVDALSLALKGRRNGGGSWYHLRLSNVVMGDSCATKVAWMLHNNPCWRKLDLGSRRACGIQKGAGGLNLLRLVTSLEMNSSWETVDFGHARGLLMDQAADQINKITAANPAWKCLQFDCRGKMMISVAPSAKSVPSGEGCASAVPLLMNGAIEDNRMVVAKATATKSVNSCSYPCPMTCPVDNRHTEFATIGHTPRMTGEICLELALRHGLSKIKNVNSIKSKFLDLGKRLLDVADSLGHINRVRMEMAGGAGNQVKQLPPLRLEQVKQIYSFGVHLAMLMFLLVRDIEQPQYDVFISFAGEDRRARQQDYVGMLLNQILSCGLTVFVDKVAMRAGKTSYPLATMLANVLTARVVVCVVSVHYVQKKWPMAELLCGLARNIAAGPLGKSPLIVDAMPGCQWTLDASSSSSSTQKRHPQEWLGDLTVLLPTQLPSMQIYEVNTYLPDHIKVVAILAQQALAFSNRLPAVEASEQLSKGNQSATKQESASPPGHLTNPYTTSGRFGGCGGTRILIRNIVHI
ncbi:hypothetical protein ACA910_010951 [Epithemia clementina (nom. ined.)]